MARRDHDPGQSPQLLLQERRGVIVKMVCGLVQQHRGGPANQQRTEREPAALPARE